MEALLTSNPKPKDSIFSYGTAGFRTKHELLPSVMIKMGALAAARSADRDGRTIGLMVTASHNLVKGEIHPRRAHTHTNNTDSQYCITDNGIKLIDWDGGMLAQAWEPKAEEFANADVSAFLASFRSSTSSYNNAKVRVVVGYDTRPHSKRLAELAVLGASSCGFSSLKARDIVNVGVVTTPQLHHIVRITNAPHASQFPPTVEGYALHLARGLERVLRRAPKGQPPLRIAVDCAHGVGGVQFPSVYEACKSTLETHGIYFDLCNVGDEPLRMNNKIGAEHVQKTQTFPIRFDGLRDAKAKYGASFDGDADRLVLYVRDSMDGLTLLDGDKIGCLIAKHLAKTCALDATVVQTAYANGASMSYLSGLGLSAPLTKTGVKYLHHEAVKHRVAVYFEANGHGTVLFDGGDHLKGYDDDADALRELANQATGDAMSDLLLATAILRVLGMSMEDWTKMYVELPSKQSKVVVPDRTVVKTNENETRLNAPIDLQTRVDEAVSRIGGSSRAFVRPSGTEDVVRIYAEAETQEQADELATALETAITDVLFDDDAKRARIH